MKEISHNINLIYEKKRVQQKKINLGVISQLRREVTSKEKKIKKLLKSKNTLQSQLLKVNKNHGKIKPHLGNVFSEGVLWQVKEKSSPEFKSHELKTDFKPNNLQISTEENKICRLPHCSNVCKENIKLSQDFLNENIILKKEIKEQKEVLHKLFLIYKDLLNKFNSCRNKVNFLNCRTNKEFSEKSFNKFVYEEELNVEGNFFTLCIK